MTARVSVPLLPGEHWWGGAVADGVRMPFGDVALARDLGENTGLLHDPTDGANQAAPLLVSDQGRFIGSERPFAFAFEEGRLTLTGDARLQQADKPSLREAFRAASATYFPPSGKTPARELFDGPQYNTWIEAPYTPTQEGVLGYVRRLVEAGFPPGVLMIDDSWSPGYGVWTFDPVRFPDPRAMLDELRALGFPVMLWIVPFVSPDTATFRELRQQGLLLRDETGEVAIRQWWNGYSAVLDLTHPAATAWLDGQLERLMELGVAGFKFDGGDVRDYRHGDRAHVAAEPVDQTEAWGRYGLDYPFNEFRAGWRLGGQPLAQRLHDKPATWDDRGLRSLIPEGIAQGLIGHPFTCADMVGGGDIASFAPGVVVDQELFVRYAQCAALFPMMQFSISPARVLDAAHLRAVHLALGIRDAFLPRILELADHAAQTGEPIIRALAYHFDGFADVADEFLLGDSILVAPVLEPGATKRRVILPPGLWRASDSAAPVSGVVELDVDLSSLPVFTRVS
ncbi:MAG TPA: glycoside hydrolase family 31 protein [Plantibacter sp.]|uniref:glycoside hydrolase family 31 protein n=1 Tax=unclassified Plantibacter TaxID=2624265 RepID=UPI002CC64816|nr:glycoside hydrolase family 31 protein [Plantibacter sp.]